MSTTQPSIVAGPHLKLALMLGIVSVIASLTSLPYIQALMPQLLAAYPPPLWVGAALWVAKHGVECWLLGWLGLWLGARHGLNAPWLRAWIYRRPRPTQRPRWLLAVLLGTLATLIVLGTAAMQGQMQHLPQRGVLLDAAWRGGLSALFGGTVEEIQLRLFTVSLLVWLLAWTHRRETSPWMFAAAIVLAALLFGAGHLPTAFAIGMPRSLATIVQVVVPNAIVGLPCGWLFWKYGLEHAMLAHFSADIVVHALTPLALGLLA
jgi:hypothetical protein